jgi:protease I
MSNTDDKKVAILVDSFFEQAEFEEPIRRLENEGIQVDVISGDEMKLQGMQHTAMGDKFTADSLIENVSPEDYDALILPGGVVNSDKLRMNPKARAWVKNFFSNGKTVAAICHAPWLLVSAGVIGGRKMTSYETLQDDIRNAGGQWTDKSVVVDQNLITSRTPDDLDDFNEAIIESLSKNPILLTA